MWLPWGRTMSPRLAPTPAKRWEKARAVCTQSDCARGVPVSLEQRECVLTAALLAARVRARHNLYERHSI